MYIFENVVTSIRFARRGDVRRNPLFGLLGNIDSISEHGRAPILADSCAQEHRAVFDAEVGHHRVPGPGEHEGVLAYGVKGGRVVGEEYLLEQFSQAWGGKHGRLWT